MRAGVRAGVRARVVGSKRERAALAGSAAATRLLPPPLQLTSTFQAPRSSAASPAPSKSSRKKVFGGEGSGGDAGGGSEGGCGGVCGGGDRGRGGGGVGGGGVGGGGEGGCLVSGAGAVTAAPSGPTHSEVSAAVQHRSYAVCSYPGRSSPAHATGSAALWLSAQKLASVEEASHSTSMHVSVCHGSDGHGTAQTLAPAFWWCWHGSMSVRAHIARW